jgi:two-component system, cell cycle response regulator CpdR
MARILLAEDDENLRFFLARALRRAGHEVSDYGDGESALGFMNEHAVDLLLADVVMPGIDMWPHLRVIFITGFAAVALREARAMSTEATVLEKPFHLRQLVNEIDRFLAA